MISMGFDSMYDPVLVCEGWVFRQIAVNLVPYQLPVFQTSASLPTMQWIPRKGTLRTRHAHRTNRHVACGLGEHDDRKSLL